jgi:hypothetical protein
MFRKEVRELIWVYLFVSLGSLLLHLRIHPPKDSMFKLSCRFCSIIP